LRSNVRTLQVVVTCLVMVACGGSGPSTTQSAPAALTQVPDRIIVELLDPENAEAAEEIRKEFEGVTIERIGDSSFYALELPPGTDLEELLKELEGDLRVVDGELDYYGRAPEGGPSDAPIFGSDLFDAIPVQASLLPLGLDAAHALSTGAGVVVAVVDTGVDFGHPYLAGRLAPGGFDFVDGDPDPAETRNGIDDDLDGAIDEQYGHGTFVASLVLTVAPDARVLPVRVLDDDGIGTASGVAAGIRWAVDNGARVINVSVDIPNDPRIVKDAVEYAEDHDVVIVAAAGNGGLNDVIFPARYSDVMAVAAVDDAGVLAPFSNFGDKVSVVAPGVHLLGAMPQDLNPAGTARWSGTSFSCPLAAGAAALVRAAVPAADRSAVRNRLEGSAMSLQAQNPDMGGRMGAGLVQPAGALLP